MRMRFRLVLAIGLFALAAAVCAQPAAVAPPPGSVAPPAAMPPPPPGTYTQPGTSASPPLPGEQDHISRFVGVDGALVTIVYGPPHDRNYGPKPPFSQLDVNRDGLITRDEAEAYLPLFNDYDNLVHHGPGVTPRLYDHWDQR